MTMTEKQAEELIELQRRTVYLLERMCVSDNIKIGSASSLKKRRKGGYNVRRAK